LSIITLNTLVVNKNLFFKEELDKNDVEINLHKVFSRSIQKARRTWKDI